MNTDNFQDTIEKDVDTDSENSDMFDYLTGNSTVMETKGTKKNECIWGTSVMQI